VLTIGLLILDHCLVVSWEVAMQWEVSCLKCYLSKRDRMMCCLGSNDIWRWYWLLILSKLNWMGMSLVIALTFHNSNVQKAPMIHRAAYFCIFFSSFKKWKTRALLKYYSWKSYKAIEKMYILYNSCLCSGEKYFIEFPSIFILLIVDSTLLV